MAVTAERARALALSLPGATAAPHVHRVAFRTPRRIFATPDAAAGDINLMLGQDLRDHDCERAPDAFSPVPGGWGRMGITRCGLAAAQADVLIAALQAAHALAAPKARKRR
jgi:hypothetical protein